MEHYLFKTLFILSILVSKKQKNVLFVHSRIYTRCSKYVEGLKEKEALLNYISAVSWRLILRSKKIPTLL